MFLIDIKYDNNLSSFYNLLNEEIINNYSNLNYKIIGLNFIAIFCKYNNINLIMNDILNLNISKVDLSLLKNEIIYNGYNEDLNIVIINRNVSNNRRTIIIRIKCYCIR